MTIFLGFIIALVVGLTGMGGGSFATPALVLLLGLSAGEAVGTAMLYAAVLRLIAAPMYLLRQQVHGPYVVALLLGAIPGLLLGTWLLHRIGAASHSPAVMIIIGAMLAVSSAISFAPRLQNRQLARERRAWLSLAALPIGVETGFSSAGAGALGSILLLNFSELLPAQVVGTDLMFGLVLAVLGGAFHLSWGSVDRATLTQLLWGGIPGIVLGALVSRVVPGKRLRTAVAVVAFILGAQMIWTGTSRALEKKTVVRVETERR